MAGQLSYRLTSVDTFLQITDDGVIQFGKCGLKKFSARTLEAKLFTGKDLLTCGSYPD
jgi:hypothetical protein